ncbi:VENN motif pre-toxin domain-containing protein [Rosenbergiella epipactidis]|uniref:VENN motif pre-toxin domain-containing protein n=1 Tax=Rosenbergiella epipactidis TaxID=1544694 RepID=UPI001F4E9318|nr:VENN motif pre-toxin domain-containing protein [Rosenbergiella epipactidis]
MATTGNKEKRDNSTTYTDDQLRETAEFKKASQPFGTGGDIQRAITASTAAIQGLAEGDVAKALAGASAPYLAEVIHRQTTSADGEVNKTANLMAHAVVNAALSLAKGENALAGASSAVTAEAVGLISQAYYDKKPTELKEDEKQTVSALASLAAGLAGGLVGGDTASAVSGMQTGKVTVENNLMGGTEDGQEKFVREHGKNIASCADNPGSASCQKGLAMQDALMVALPAGLGGGILAAATPEIAASAKAAIQACAGNVVLCLNNAGIQVSEAIVPGGVGTGGAVGIGKTAAEATAAKAEVVAASKAMNGAESASNGARLRMQLAAEQSAGSRAPTKITSYSQHALEQIAGRDGGIGVSKNAIDNAWSSPLKIEYVPSKYGPTFRYTGNAAVIVVNQDGKVVTGWAKSSSGTAK